MLVASAVTSFTGLTLPSVQAAEPLEPPGKWQSSASGWLTYRSQALRRHRGLEEEEKGLAGQGLTTAKALLAGREALGSPLACHRSWRIDSALTTRKETKQS